MIVRHTDMTYEVKCEVTKIINEVLQEESTNKAKISKLIT